MRQRCAELAVVDFDAVIEVWLVILPKAGDLANFEDHLDTTKLESIFASLQPGEVLLSLPSFQFKKRVLLKEKLMAMGMKLTMAAPNSPASAMAAHTPSW